MKGLDSSVPQETSWIIVYAAASDTMSCDACQRNTLLKCTLCNKVSVCVIVIDGNRDVCKAGVYVFAGRGMKGVPRALHSFSLSLSLHFSRVLALRHSSFPLI